MIVLLLTSHHQLARQQYLTVSRHCLGQYLRRPRINLQAVGRQMGHGAYHQCQPRPFQLVMIGTFKETTMNTTLSATSHPRAQHRRLPHALYPHHLKASRRRHKVVRRHPCLQCHSIKSPSLRMKTNFMLNLHRENHTTGHRPHHHKHRLIIKHLLYHLKNELLPLHHRKNAPRLHYHLRSVLPHLYHRLTMHLEHPAQGSHSMSIAL